MLWRPSPERVAASRLTAFAGFAAERYGAPTGSYDALWQWSVDALEDFWAAAWEFFDVRASAPYERVLTERTMPGCRWFPGARLNFAENVLRPTGRGPR